jgi:two-component system LytT family response regulator
MRVVIVDDEALARRGIRARLARWPDITILAEAHDATSGMDAVLTHRPDVVFLDIAMPGADGFALLNGLPADVRPLSIFVTAHEDRALEAIEVQALDYVLKPIDDARFLRALERARARLLERGPGSPGRLLVRDRGEVHVLESDAIDWIQSEGDYVRIYAGRRTYLHLASMRALEAELSARDFVRVHRSAIVNVTRVRSLAPLTNGDYTLVLSTGVRLRLSRTRRVAFMMRFGPIG